MTAKSLFERWPSTARGVKRKECNNDHFKECSYISKRTLMKCREIRPKSELERNNGICDEGINATVVCLENIVALGGLGKPESYAGRLRKGFHLEFQRMLRRGAERERVYLEAEMEQREGLSFEERNRFNDHIYSEDPSLTSKFACLPDTFDVVQSNEEGDDDPLCKAGVWSDKEMLERRARVLRAQIAQAYVLRELYEEKMKRAAGRRMLEKKKKKDNEDGEEMTGDNDEEEEATTNTTVSLPATVTERERAIKEAKRVYGMAQREMAKREARILIGSDVQKKPARVCAFKKEREGEEEEKCSRRALPLTEFCDFHSLDCDSRQKAFVPCDICAAPVLDLARPRPRCRVHTELYEWKSLEGEAPRLKPTLHAKRRPYLVRRGGIAGRQEEARHIMDTLDIGIDDEEREEKQREEAEKKRVEERERGREKETENSRLRQQQLLLQPRRATPAKRSDSGTNEGRRGTKRRLDDLTLGSTLGYRARGAGTYIDHASMTAARCRFYDWERAREIKLEKAKRGHLLGNQMGYPLRMMSQPAGPSSSSSSQQQQQPHFQNRSVRTRISPVALSRMPKSYGGTGSHDYGVIGGGGGASRQQQGSHDHLYAGGMQQPYEEASPEREFDEEEEEKKMEEMAAAAGNRSRGIMPRPPDAAPPHRPRAAALLKPAMAKKPCILQRHSDTPSTPRPRPAPSSSALSAATERLYSRTPAFAPGIKQPAPPQKGRPPSLTSSSTRGGRRFQAATSTSSQALRHRRNFSPPPPQLLQSDRWPLPSKREPEKTSPSGGGEMRAYAGASVTAQVAAAIPPLLDHEGMARAAPRRPPGSLQPPPAVGSLQAPPPPRAPLSSTPRGPPPPRAAGFSEGARPKLPLPRTTAVPPQLQSSLLQSRLSKMSEMSPSASSQGNAPGTSSSSFSAPLNPNTSMLPPHRTFVRQSQPTPPLHARQAPALAESQVRTSLASMQSMQPRLPLNRAQLPVRSATMTAPPQKEAKTADSESSAALTKNPPPPARTEPTSSGSEQQPAVAAPQPSGPDFDALSVLADAALAGEVSKGGGPEGKADTVGVGEDTVIPMDTTVDSSSAPFPFTMSDIEEDDDVEEEL